MTRLTAHVATVLGLAGALPGRAQVDAGPFDYRQVEIARGVYGFFETQLNPIVSGNVIAVIGNDAVLIFDTGHHPPITRRIIADLKRITDKPVRYVVVSHWHDDHWVGNAEFADAWPGVQIIAHPFTATLMEQRKEKFRGDSCKAELEEDSRSLREQLASGKRPDGSPLSDATKERMGRFVRAVDEQLGQCDGMRYRGVDRQMADTLKLDLGGRSVILMYLGRGNTAGDLVAWLPSARTILTGDLLVHPFPFATESYISEWSRALNRIDGMHPATIVPGHGPVMHDAGYLEDVIAVLESIERQARAAYRPGMTADQLRERIDLTAFGERFGRGDPFIKANFDNMMSRSAVERMWQELSGQWKPEGE